MDFFLAYNIILNYKPKNTFWPTHFFLCTPKAIPFLRFFSHLLLS